MASLKTFVFTAAVMGMMTGVLRADMNDSMNMPQDKTVKTESMPSTDQPTPMQHKKHKHGMKKHSCDPATETGCTAQGKMGGMPSDMGPGGSMGGMGSGGQTNTDTPQDPKTAPMGHM